MSRRRAAGRPEHGDQHLSYDVKIWKIRTYERKSGNTYGVRWIVGGQEHHDLFATYALADAYRSKLLSYQRKGVPFDIESGLPEPMLRERSARSWYQHMCKYIDAKWSKAAPKSRRSIADSLATVTPALMTNDRPKVTTDELRELVYGWVCVKPARDAGPPADHLRSALRELEKCTIDLAVFQDRVRGPEVTRKALDLLAVRLDGKPAAATTLARKRAVFYNTLEFGVEDGVLGSNPIDNVTWRMPKQSRAIDKGAVVSLHQGKQLLIAVGSQGAAGQRLVPFFGSMMFAALRPAEAIALAEQNLVSLPDEGWGELLLSGSQPRAGIAWSDTGTSREARGLKHRARTDTRRVPLHPELVGLIQAHIEEFGFGPGGKLFAGRFGGLPTEKSYLAIWKQARAIALTPAEVASKLARRPYDLRHFAISYWLNAGVSVSQAAEWAGNSEAVIWAVYAKLINGKDAEARRQVERAMRFDLDQQE
jgi:integrase